MWEEDHSMHHSTPEELNSHLNHFDLLHLAGQLCWLHAETMKVFDYRYSSSLVTNVILSWLNVSMESFKMHATPQLSSKRLMDERHAVVCWVILHNQSPTVCGWGLFLPQCESEQCYKKYILSVHQKITTDLKVLSGIVSRSNSLTLQEVFWWMLWNVKCY